MQISYRFMVLRKANRLIYLGFRIMFGLIGDDVGDAMLTVVVVD